MHLNTKISTPHLVREAQRTGQVERLLRLSEVLCRTGLSRSAVYAGMKNETFPTSISLGARTVAWAESAIDAWIAERVAASRNLDM
jgi:prophage regulatory protein